MSRSTCKSCDARVLWVRLNTGTPAPLDPTPHPAGNVTLSPDGQTATVLDLEAERDLSPDVERYVLHFVTCPNAKAHRRKR